MTLVICACVLNISTHIPTLKVRLEQFSSAINAHTTHIILVYSEHDTSNTLELLKEWQLTDQRLILLPDRVSHRSNYSSVNLGTARNVYMRYIEEHVSPTPQWMLVVDADDKLTEWQFDYEGLTKCIHQQTEWDALSVLSIPYWDWFAFRHPALNMVNCWELERLGTPHTTTLSSSVKWASSLHSTATQTPTFHAVLSAFSACTLYKWDKVSGLRYDYNNEYSRRHVLPDCEHFHYHLQLVRERRARLVVSTAFTSRLMVEEKGSAS